MSKKIVVSFPGLLEAELRESGSYVYFKVFSQHLDVTCKSGQPATLFQASNGFSVKSSSNVALSINTVWLRGEASFHNGEGRIALASIEDCEKYIENCVLALTEWANEEPQKSLWEHSFDVTQLSLF